MYNLADINGKLANFSDDVSNKDFSGGDFKQFISGARFQARHPYGRPFTVTKVPLMLCCVNEVPPTTDDTQGHFRRLLPILCPNQIADKDVDVALPQKLATKEAKAAIFNWVLEGYRMLCKNNGKITISESIKEVKNEIQEDSNSARRWIKEYNYGVVEPVNSLDVRWKPMKEWMREYQMYCKDYSEIPKSTKAVSKIFKELGFVSEKRADTTWYCIGTKSEVKREVPQEVTKVVDVVDDGDLPFS
jgi:putative DNA primase/helicase